MDLGILPCQMTQEGNCYLLYTAIEEIPQLLLIQHKIVKILNIYIKWWTNNNEIVDLFS
jgi:hypothetical protein